MKNRDEISNALFRVLDIITRLRAPDGCPWDREQTPDSVRKYIREETYELLEAIENSDHHETCEELGDTSFLLFFVAAMYEEQDIFSLSEALNMSADKMIRRHPHIFGEVTVSGTEDVITNWQEIKKQEAAEKGKKSSVLGNLPKGLPALQRAFRLGERASRVGFDWEDRAGILEKIEEEKMEMEHAIEANKKESIKDEIGDLLFTVCNLARHFDINPEDALSHANQKFIDRFQRMEKILEDQGMAPSDTDVDVMNQIWEQVKKEG